MSLAVIAESPSWVQKERVARLVGMRRQHPEAFSQIEKELFLSSTLAICGMLRPVGCPFVRGRIGHLSLATECLLFVRRGITHTRLNFLWTSE